MGDRPNFLVRYRNVLTRGSTVAMGLVLAFGFAAGIVFWGSFNTVLEALGVLGIAHEKTPEKIIFRSTAHEPAGGDAGPFAGLDLSGLRDLPPDQMMAAAAKAMQQLTPEQNEALRGMMESMTPEQRAEMMEQAKKMGIG